MADTAAWVADKIASLADVLEHGPRSQTQQRPGDDAASGPSGGPADDVPDAISIHLDHPEQGAELDHELHVAGWAFAREGELERIEVRLGRVLVGTLEREVERPDVQRDHPDLPSPRVGFAGNFPVPAGLQHEQPLVLSLTDTRGNVVHVDRTVRVVRSEPVPTLREPVPAKPETPALDPPMPDAPINGAILAELESPAQGSEHIGTIHVAGWAFSRTHPLAHIEVRLGARLLGYARRELDRPDVERAFPELPSQRAGFAEEFPVPAGLGPEQVLGIRLVDLAGNVRVLERSVRIVEPSALPGTEEPAGEGSRHAAPEASPIGDEWLVPWLRCLAAEQHLMRGHVPSFLLWDLDVGSLDDPRLTLMRPPRFGLETLPYLDGTIDTVVVAGSDPARLREAERVASSAVVHVPVLRQTESPTVHRVESESSPGPAHTPRRHRSKRSGHRRRALVVAPDAPDYDRQSGSKRVLHMMQYLREAGWEVAFVGHAPSSARYAKEVGDLGIATGSVETLSTRFPDGSSADPSTWSSSPPGPAERDRDVPSPFDLVLLHFWYIAEHYLPVVRSLCPDAPVLIDSVDLHFLRETRSVMTGGPTGADAQFGERMCRELDVYTKADAVLTVSEKEARLLRDFMATSVSTYCVPDAEPIRRSSRPFEERSGVVFVANFQHPPNIEGAHWFLDEVLPQLPASFLERHPVRIVGNRPPPSLLRHEAVVRGAVQMIGWVPSVEPYIEQSRISILPLLSGAGTKRKLIHALMRGTPSVSTTVGAEGLHVDDGSELLVADPSEKFAQAMTRLATDPHLWQRISDRGHEWAAAERGPAAARTRLESALERIFAQRTGERKQQRHVRSFGPSGEPDEERDERWNAGNGVSRSLLATESQLRSGVQAAAHRAARALTHAASSIVPRARRQRTAIGTPGSPLPEPPSAASSVPASSPPSTTEEASSTDPDTVAPPDGGTDGNGNGATEMAPEGLVQIRRKDTTGTINRHKDLRGRFCSRPFSFFETSADGRAWVCCPSWLNTSIGHVAGESVEEIWNSEPVKAIRRSILDGTYEYCDQLVCPEIQSDKLPRTEDVQDPRLRKYIDEDRVELDELPTEYNFAFDQSCNLSCPSCRQDKILHTSGPEYEQTKATCDKLLDAILEEAQRRPVEMLVTGSGDPFGSKVFRELLMNLDGRPYPNLRILLQTNGVMFTRRYWEKMWRIHDNIRSVLVSFDAATEETYQFVRRGGHWGQLQKNIRFLSGLRERGAIEFLTMDFVVQQRNFREMPDFVKMAREIGNIDEVRFSLVYDWDTWSPEEYRQHAVWKKDHPEWNDFIEVLKDPIFELPNVRLGNVREYRDYARSLQGSSATAAPAE